ncbi:MAG: orotate phosphoribosyltransferase [Gemmatimonadetes bacterium]|nr:orotate phosphoribosyltransferase [Gemmatimonadota bacterium]
MSPRNQELLQLLKDFAYRRGTFKLSSGGESDYYIDAKTVTQHPRGMELIAESILEILQRYNVQAVGGPILGAVPIATAVAMLSGQRGSPLPAFFVRKDPKTHGLHKLIEGPVPDGATVAIVDDVITSGQSVIEAVEHAEQEGYKVAVVISLVDRESGGREKIQSRGIRYENVFSINDLRSRSTGTTSNPQIPAHA